MSLACQFHNSFRRYNHICFHLLILVLLTGFSSAGSAATAASSAFSYKNTVAGQYKQASDYYYKLKDNPSAARKREKWQAGIHELQRIYRIDPKSEIASSCLYTIARMYRGMYKRFEIAADLDKAIAFYTDTLTFFPQGRKADNALYALAQIEQKERNNSKQAAKHYYELIKSYPDSRKKTQAEKQLQKLISALKDPSAPQKNQVAKRAGNKEKKEMRAEGVLPVPKAVIPVKDEKDAPSGLGKKDIVPQAPQAKNKSVQRVEAAERAGKPVSRTKIVLSALKNVTSGQTQKDIRLPKSALPSVKKKTDEQLRKDIVAKTVAAAIARPVAASPRKPQQSEEKKAAVTREKIGGRGAQEQSSETTGKIVIQPPREQFATGNKYLERARGTVKVLPVQYWSSDNYSRVVIKASEPVEYHASLLDKTSKSPKHLSIDFKKSYIPPKYRSPVSIEDGLLKRIHTGQLDKTTVRVYLETESIADYKVFSLKDPFRVVVDVRGVKGMALKAPKKKTPPHIETAVKQVEQVAELVAESKKIAVSVPKEKKKSSPAPAVTPSQKANSLTLAQQLGLGVRRIVIDPGHGGKDPGATGFGLKEKEIVLNVAKKIRKILEEKHDYEVFLTRKGDESLSLEERTAIANTKEADLFLSIHVNAHPEESVRGVETFYLNLATHTEAMRVAARENATSTHNMSEMQDILAELMQNEKINESSQLAEFVQLNMVSGLKEQKYRVKDLGVKQAPFYVLIGAEMPAVLAEISFITNQDEAKLLKDEKYLQTLAEQIVAGVISYAEHQKTAVLDL
jgi:N-acetylmuramoyl-L-alanine amidase